MPDPSRPWATDEYERLVEAEPPPPPAPVGTDRPPGPVAQGSPPDGAPAPSGPSPTRHPEDSVTPAEPAPEPGDAEPLVEVEEEGRDGAGVASEDEVDTAVEEAEERVEADLDELARISAERDDYLLRLQRLQADFENYKKRVLKQQSEHQERAAEDLVGKLLPVLDNFDLAVAHGTEGVQPVYRSLLDVLEGSGLERIDPAGQPFDPNEHDAVMHEPGGNAPEVIDVLRAGYRWRGRILRPAMVKVKG